MKKFVLLIVILLLPIMVYAEDYDVKTLIPVNTKVSVKTEKFDYNNFVYNSNVDSKGNGLITFESIKNNTVTKKPVSINILLFGEDQKNIGFVTYCTNKDLDSNYADFELAGNASAPFSINVVSKYFVDGKTTKDVKYIAVLDENKYCQVGGYDKYSELTLDQIANGVVTKEDDNDIHKYIVKLQDSGMMMYIIIGLVGLAILVIFIMIISGIVNKIKNHRRKKLEEQKKNDRETIEETVNLSYGNVKDDEVEEDSISMGEINNTFDDIGEEDNDEEDDGDLTKFFN